jgi:predicted Zn-ribbon and HTH transcriptional regulator
MCTYECIVHYIFIKLLCADNSRGETKEMRNSIGSNNNNNNNNNNSNRQILTNYWVWFIAYMAIGLAISFVVPFPFSLGIALLVFVALNAARMHIALKRQGMPSGLKDVYKSMTSSLGGSWNNSVGTGMVYSPIKFYCINCGYEHRETACPKCGSKAVRTG